MRKTSSTESKLKPTSVAGAIGCTASAGGTIDAGVAGGRGAVRGRAGGIGARGRGAMRLIAEAISISLGFAICGVCSAIAVGMGGSTACGGSAGFAIGAGAVIAPGCRNLL